MLYDSEGVSEVNGTVSKRQPKFGWINDEHLILRQRKTVPMPVQPRQIDTVGVVAEIQECAHHGTNTTPDIKHFARTDRLRKRNQVFDDSAGVDQFLVRSVFVSGRVRYVLDLSGEETSVAANRLTYSGQVHDRTTSRRSGFH